MLNVLKQRHKIDREPLIVAKVDDGTGTDTKIVWPYFKSLGLVACFQVIASRVGVPSTGGGRYPEQWADYKASIADGFEIGSHLYDHENATTLTTEELHLNIQKVKAKFLENGLPIPTHMTFPGGNWNDLSVSIARQYYESVAYRKTSSGGYESWDTIHRDRFNVISMDVYDDAIFPSRIAQIDKIKNEGLIGILSLHRITGDTTGRTDLSRTDL